MKWKRTGALYLLWLAITILLFIWAQYGISDVEVSIEHIAAADVLGPIPPGGPNIDAEFLKRIHSKLPKPKFLPRSSESSTNADGQTSLPPNIQVDPDYEWISGKAIERHVSAIAGLQQTQRLRQILTLTWACVAFLPLAGILGRAGREHIPVSPRPQ